MPTFRRTTHLELSARRPREQGFTLLEVLIAITITGLIGVGTYQLFNSTMRTQAVMEGKGEKLERMQRAMAFISRDMQQLVPRPVRNGYGDQEFALTNRNSLYLLELTRLGWRNPMLAPRSELQRVIYELVDGKLYRSYYPVLDRAQETELRSQELLDEVEEVTLQFLDEKNQWHDDWPLERMFGENSDEHYKALPKAVRIEIVHQTFGTVYRLYDTVGYYRTPTTQVPGGNTGGENQDGDDSGGIEAVPQEGGQDEESQGGFF